MKIRCAGESMIGVLRHREFPFSLREDAFPAIERDGVLPDVLGGHAAVFDVIAHREVIRHGAFDETLERIASGKSRAYGYWNHNSDLILGATENETLRLGLDDDGVIFGEQPPDTQLGRDAVTLIRAGYITRMSFGFIPLEEEAIKDEDGDFLFWEVRKVRLLEVSPVPFAWYDTTDVGVRDRVMDELGEAVAGGDLAAARRILEPHLSTKGTKGHEELQNSDGNEPAPVSSGNHSGDGDGQPVFDLLLTGGDVDGVPRHPPII